jgi:hypothetical protein
MAPNSFTFSFSLRIAVLLLAFLAGLVAIDRAAAFCLTQLLQGITTGQASGGLINAALQHADSSVIVFGSSLANHHISPAKIEESTGLKCFNAGCDGQNIHYARMLQALLLKNGTRAKVFVYMLNWNDLFLNNSSAANIFGPFRGQSQIIDDMLNDNQLKNRFKSLSHTYRFNGLAIPILRQRLKPNHEGELGFLPLESEFRDSHAELARVARESSITEITLEQMHAAEKKIAIYEDFVNVARSAGLEVLLVKGPTLRLGVPAGVQERFATEQFQALAERTGGTFLQLDETRFPEFAEHESFYSDRLHLNKTGALRMSELLSDYLIPWLRLR